MYFVTVYLLCRYLLCFCENYDWPDPFAFLSKPLVLSLFCFVLIFQAAATSLQALSAFARRTYSSEAESRVSVTVGNSRPYYVTVNAENRLLQQTYKVKDVEVSSVHWRRGTLR